MAIKKKLSWRDYQPRERREENRERFYWKEARGTQVWEGPFIIPPTSISVLTKELNSETRVYCESVIWYISYFAHAMSLLGAKELSWRGATYKSQCRREEGGGWGRSLEWKLQPGARGRIVGEMIAFHAAVDQWSWLRNWLWSMWTKNIQSNDAGESGRDSECCERGRSLKEHEESSALLQQLNRRARPSGNHPWKNKNIIILPDITPVYQSDETVGSCKREVSRDLQWPWIW